MNSKYTTLISIKNFRMLNFFCKIYKNTVWDNQSALTFRCMSACRFTIRVLANILLPIYFIITKNNENYSLAHKDKKKYPGIIISLTSFPARINKIWLVVETLLRQSYKPDKIILYLSKEQFLNYRIPKRLQNLTKRGLEIVFVENDFKPHKKYYYSMQQYPNSDIITVDDDIFYDTHLIENLIKYKNENKGCIISNKCSRIVYDTNGRIKNYTKWEKSQQYSIDDNNFIIGCGGVLYPPNSFGSLLFNDAIFMKVCPLTDDIWLNLMARLNNTRIFVTDNALRLPIINNHAENLYSQNIEGNNNDSSIHNLESYFKYSMFPKYNN